MNKLLIAVLGSLVLVGCGEKSELELKLEHERAMAQIEVQKIKAANQVSDTYNVEYEYEIDDRGYSEPIVYDETPRSSMDVSTLHSQAPSVPVEQGYSGGEMLAGVAAGALAGYAANEMLNNGMKTYTDNKGNTVYVDKNGKQISKEQYNAYKKKNPKATKLREKVSNAKDKAKVLGTKAKDKVKAGYQKAKDSKTGRKVQAAAKKTQRKVKQKANKYKAKAKAKYKSNSKRR
jgi:hypothetical protein